MGDRCCLGTLKQKISALEKYQEQMTSAWIHLRDRHNIAIDGIREEIINRSMAH